MNCALNPQQSCAINKGIKHAPYFSIKCESECVRCLMRAGGVITTADWSRESDARCPYNYNQVRYGSRNSKVIKVQPYVCKRMQVGVVKLQTVYLWQIRICADDGVIVA